MPSGRASDSGARGRGFDPHSGRRVVSLSKKFTFQKVLVIPRKQWLRPDMNEKLLKPQPKQPKQKDKPVPVSGNHSRTKVTTIFLITSRTEHIE